jgi:hypothetical protein
MHRIDIANPNRHQVRKCSTVVDHQRCRDHYKHLSWSCDGCMWARMLLDVTLQMLCCIRTQALHAEH